MRLIKTLLNPAVLSKMENIIELLGTKNLDNIVNITLNIRHARNMISLTSRQVIVQANNVIRCRHKLLGQMRAYEPGAAGNENLFGPKQLKYGIRVHFGHLCVCMPERSSSKFVPFYTWASTERLGWL